MVLVFFPQSQQEQSFISFLKRGKVTVLNRVKSKGGKQLYLHTCMYIRHAHTLSERKKHGMKNADLKVPELQRYTWQSSGIRNDGKIKKTIKEVIPTLA